uniref:Putative secreted protein n=1 Tax=Anopheles darlingi TaxID=43151 RepID=A0A2M4DJ91_ANODA
MTHIRTCECVRETYFHLTIVVVVVTVANCASPPTLPHTCNFAHFPFPPEQPLPFGGHPIFWLVCCDDGSYSRRRSVNWTFFSSPPPKNFLCPSPSQKEL